MFVLHMGPFDTVYESLGFHGPLTYILRNELEL